MSIKSIKIENFKSIGRGQFFEFGKVNLIFGPNSSGKSSILQSILLLNNILNNGEADVFESKWGVELGGFSNFVHMHDQDTKVKLIAVFEAITPIGYNGSLNKNSEYSIGIDISAQGISKVVYSENSSSIFALEITERPLPNSVRSENNYYYRVSELEINSPGIKDLTHKYFTEFSRIYDYGSEESKRLTFINLLKHNIESSRKIDFQDIVTQSRSISESMQGSRGSIDLRDTAVGIQLGSSLPRINVNSLFGYRQYFDRDFLKTLSELFGIFDEQYKKSPDTTARFVSLRRLLENHIIGADAILSLNRYIDLINIIEEFAVVYLDHIIEIHRYCSSEIRSINHIGPVRWHPNRRLYESELKRNNLPEYRNWLSLFGTSKQVLSINNMLTSLNLNYEIKISRVFLDGKTKRSQTDSFDRVLELLDKKAGINVAYRDVGTGISQVIPILVGLSRNNRVLSMEQPELHLHPAMQAQLMDVIIESQFSARVRNRILLVETHSEHMILRLQRRIRETRHEKNSRKKVNATDIKVLFTLPTEFGLQIVNLELDEDGSFTDPWPGGFFEERLEELKG